tara:strand:- start:465 stop:587 length:123 start_codon:yes stop_codon:yes gene_type:complete
MKEQQSKKSEKKSYLDYGKYSAKKSFSSINILTQGRNHHG